MQMVRTFHRLNFYMFSDMKPHILTEIVKVIPRSEWPSELENCDRLQRNLADFLFHDVQAYAVNACQLHLQSLRDVVWNTKESQWISVGPSAGAPNWEMKAMPEHHDGGRAFLVWAIVLWTQRTVLVWDCEDNHDDLQTFSGHTYFAGFLGPKHQVRHEYHTGEHALVSDKLCPREAVLSDAHVSVTTS